MSCNQLWRQAMDFSILGGVEFQSRYGSCIEGLAYQGIGDPTKPFCFDPIRGASPMYAAGELLWYMSGADSGDMICAYASSYTNFLTKDGIAEGAYGPRIFASQAWRHAADEILRFESRRAVIPIFDYRDLRRLEKGTKDSPCTLSLQFINRNGALNLIVNMRSNDAWLGLPYDAFCFMMIQLMMCEITGLHPGAYWHQAGSMHVYEKDWSKYAVNDNAPRSDPPLKLLLDSEKATLLNLGGISSDEYRCRNGNFQGSESNLARFHKPNSIATTLLVLSSLNSYSSPPSDSHQEYLKSIIDSRLVERSIQILETRESKLARKSD